MNISAVAPTVISALVLVLTLTAGLAVLCRWLGGRELGGPNATVSPAAVDRVRARLNSDRQRVLDEPDSAWELRGARLAAETEAYLRSARRR
jgi:hypothetical protein